MQSSPCSWQQRCGLRLLRHGEPLRARDGALQFYAVFSVLLLGLPFTENLHLTWICQEVALLFISMAREVAPNSSIPVMIGAPPPLLR